MADRPPQKLVPSRDLSEQELPHFKKKVGNQEGITQRDGQSTHDTRFLKDKPTTLLPPPSFYRQDSGISEGSERSLAYSTISSIRSNDSGLGLSSNVSTPSSPSYRTLLSPDNEAIDFSISSLHKDIKEREEETEVKEGTSSLQDSTVIEEVTDEEITPTNSPKTTRIFNPQLTLNNLPIIIHSDDTTCTNNTPNNQPTTKDYSIHQPTTKDYSIHQPTTKDYSIHQPTTKDYSIHQPMEHPATETINHSQYERHLEMFFKLFAKDQGLCLREDTVYPAFNVKHVSALGFGIKNDRIKPCIRVYSDLFSNYENDAERSSLLPDIARHITAAVKEIEQVQLTLEDCLEFLEIDDSENAIFFPEDLTGTPGNQFKIPSAALRGTLGYFMKGELTITTDEKSLSCTKHFGVTCAHCVLPLKMIWSLVDDICKNEKVKTDYDNYPIHVLHDHMWSHSYHFTHLLSSSSSASNGAVAIYSEFTKKQGQCFIKASVCSEGVRGLVREKVKYEDCNYDTDKVHYNYVLSKFGMIPGGFSMPLPMYLFSDSKNDIYHLPFNVDIGLLEISDKMITDDSHCLETTLASHCNNETTVNGIYNKETLRDTSQYTRYDNDIPTVENPTSGTVTSISSPQMNITPSNDKQMIHPLSDTRTEGKSTDCYRSDHHASSCTGSAASSHDSTDCSDNAQYTVNKISTIDKSKYKPMHKVALKRVNKKIKTVIATGRNIFSSREQKELYLNVLSHQSVYDDRPVLRSLKVHNNQFCIEFVHRNPHSRTQYRSFPAVKWNWKTKEKIMTNDFIIPGDSGSSLLLTNKDSYGKEQHVLIGVVCSANTATRVDFVKEIISPDLFLYMSSINEQHTRSMIEILTELRKRVRIVDQLRQVSTREERIKMCKRIKANRQLMKDMEDTIQFTTTSKPSYNGEVTFKLTECIQDCTCVCNSVL